MVSDVKLGLQQTVTSFKNYYPLLKSNTRAKTDTHAHTCARAHTHTHRVRERERETRARARTHIRTHAHTHSVFGLQVNAYLPRCSAFTSLNGDAKMVGRFMTQWLAAPVGLYGVQLPDGPKMMTSAYLSARQHKRDRG